MKKIIATCLCLLIGITIGIPMVHEVGSRLRAAGEESAKAIDFDYFPIPGSNQVLYVIDENHYVHFTNSLNSLSSGKDLNALDLITDNSGRPLRNVIEVSGSGSNISAYNGIALRSDNLIYVWGDNTLGQYGNGTTSRYSNKAVLVDTGISDIASVYSTLSTNFLITKNGDVYASGDNTHGQFGDGTTASSTTFTKVGISDVKKLTGSKVGLGTIYALKNDGTLYSWGQHVYDGVDSLGDVVTPTQMYAKNQTDYITDVVDISAEGSGSRGKPGIAVLTLKDSVANVFTIGASDYNEDLLNYLQLNTLSDVSETSSISYLRGVTYYFLADGDPYSSYKNKGFVLKKHTLLRTDIPEDTKYKKIFSLDEKVISLSESGELYYQLGGNLGTIAVADRLIVNIPLRISATKPDNTAYADSEKYNSNIDLNAITTSTSAITCKVENPVGSAATACVGFSNNSLKVEAENQRVYRKYIFSNDKMSDEFIVDLYQEKPQLDIPLQEKTRLKQLILYKSLLRMLRKIGISIELLLQIHQETHLIIQGDL